MNTISINLLIGFSSPKSIMKDQNVNNSKPTASNSINLKSKMTGFPIIWAKPSKKGLNSTNAYSINIYLLCPKSWLGLRILQLSPWTLKFRKKRTGFSTCVIKSKQSFPDNLKRLDLDFYCISQIKILSFTTVVNWSRWSSCWGLSNIEGRRS